MLSTLRIRQQFLLVLGVSFALFGIAASTAIIAMDRIGQRFVDFVDHDQAALLAYTEMYAQGLQMGQALRNVLLDPANRRGYDNLAKAGSDFATALSRAEALVSKHPERLQALQSVSQLREKQRLIHEQVVAMVGTGDLEAAKTLTISDETPTWRAVRELLLKEIEIARSDAGSTKQGVIADAVRAESLAAALAIAATAVGMVMSLLTRPLNKLSVV